MMKVSKHSSPTLFNHSENNDSIDVDALLNMIQPDFIDYFKENPIDLKTALSNDKLFPKFDDFVVAALAGTNTNLCNILFNSGKFNDKPIFKIILCYKDFLPIRATLPTELGRK
jgi:hypothetical protein